MKSQSRFTFHFFQNIINSLVDGVRARPWIHVCVVWCGVCLIIMQMKLRRRHRLYYLSKKSMTGLLKRKLTIHLVPNSPGWMFWNICSFERKNYFKNRNLASKATSSRKFRAIRILGISIDQDHTIWHCGV